MVKKIILWTLAVFFLLLLTVICLPFIFKGKILEKVKTEINNNLNAKVDFEGFDLTLISSFPDFTLRLDNLIITGKGDFEGDTLTTIHQLKIGADLMSIIKGEQIKVNAIHLEKPFINLLVLKNGKANWDITKPSTTSASGSSETTSFRLSLEEYRIDQGLVRYTDEEGGMKAVLANLNHNGTGDFTQDIFILETETTIDTLDFWFGGIRYFNKTHVFLRADLDMNMPKSTYTFKENELSLNELLLGFDGFIAMPGKDIVTDIKFNAKKTDFRNFISLIPGIYQEGFKDLKSSGKLALDGFVKGTYNEKQMPGFGLNVVIQNGMFQYPSLPSSVNNVQMDLKILNADGIPDHTNIDITRLHLELASEPFDARLSIRTPVSDANLDAMVKGKINLANLSKIVPMEKGTELNGQLDVDLTAKGRMSAIEQKKYDEFQAAGHLVLSNMKYSSPDFKNGLFINTFDLTFNPKSVALNSCSIKTGKSDLQAKGQLDNLLAYLFKDQTLTGSLDFTSDLLDVNELTGNNASAASATSDSSSMTVLEIPDLIDFTTNARVKRVLYDNMVMDNLQGQVVMAGKTLNMKNLTFNMLDGTISMKGIYSSKNIKKPELDISLDIRDADIQKTVKTFTTVKKLAPIAERCNGNYGATLVLSTILNEKMSPELNTLSGAGKLKTGNVILSNVEVLNKLADAIKMTQFKQLSINDVNISFQFKDGRINIDPFDVNLAGAKTTIHGSNGFDQTIDYTMNLSIPKSLLGNQVNTAITGLLSKANALAGTSVSIPDPVKIKALVGGTVTKPVIKTSLGETGGSVINTLQDKAKEEFEKKKKELEDKAKAEVDRIKKETEDKAKAEADRIKKEAEARAKAEADKLKKEAEQKAKKAAEDQLKNLLKKPK